MATRAPKQWCLTKIETITSFENWKQNMEYTLSLDNNFAGFLLTTCKWEKKTRQSPLRGFTDDTTTTSEASRRTAAQKVAQLELMLGQIANFCPVISRNTIVKNSTSIKDIWQAIRLHYGFQTSGSHMLEFANIKLEPDERPEDLFQRLMAFIDDNLLQPDGGITHHGVAPEEEEELSPTLENVITLTWLQLLHPSLPALVKQRYGPELRSRTLASLKPEISQAMESLLSEIKSSEDVRILRAATGNLRLRGSSQRANRSAHVESSRSTMTKRSCALCRAAGRPGSDTHYLSRCRFLPEEDRRFMAGVRMITGDDSDHFIDVNETQVGESDFIVDNHVCDAPASTSVTRRVQTNPSPHLLVFSHHIPLRLTIDTGAEINLIRASTAHKLGAKLHKSSQSAIQADGHSRLNVVGEVHLRLSRGPHTMVFDALAVESLEVEALAGTPFMCTNDISVRPADFSVSLGDKVIFHYSSTGESSLLVLPVARRTSCTVRSPRESITVWPGDFVEFEVPDFESDAVVSIEPTTNFSGSSHNQTWPTPVITQLVAGRIRVPNHGDTPLRMRPHDHVCTVFSVTSDHSFLLSQETSADVRVAPDTKRTIPISILSTIKVDPDGVLPSDIRTEFTHTLSAHSKVFDNDLPGYNNAAGNICGVVNIASVQPPQRKGRLPQYNRSRLTELQTKFDELELAGVFKKPEDAGVDVEYVNPSFLVHKPSGGSRLVTDFSSVGQYSKPPPSIMPDVDSILRIIGGWKYIISTDLAQAYFQIPLSQKSMKYCGVVTPFKGTRVYARCAMGLPGSEAALEELMCRVLGELIQEGRVVKLADDLFCGGNTPQEILDTWRSVLTALENCNLRLSPSKTIICPRKASILGWVWSNGSLSASPHRISTLASCNLPTTVKQMRSFIGAYKVLSRVISNTSHLLAPLESLCAGRESADNIQWTDELTAAFHAAQQHLRSNKSIVIPRPSDYLWIVTDGSSKQQGIGATLYVTRDHRTLLAGFFSARLRAHQVSWLPCEIEALGISAATRHFAPFIIQSNMQCTVLTDSKPCVQAYERLARGDFSASPRVTTFLSAVSQYHVRVLHLAGSVNLPSDFASRNAPSCNEHTCQVCTFVSRMEDAPVRSIQVHDILSGKSRLPFATRQTWKVAQQECPDIRRTKAHLSQGTRPSRKHTNVRDVKRYLQACSLATDGVLVAKRPAPFSVTRECIVIPRTAVPGLLSALHLRLSHPTQHQLRQVFVRYFFALDLDSHLKSLYSGCHTCASLRKLPLPLVESTTTPPPSSVGSSYAADVMHFHRQLILVVRETVTSFTLTSLIPDETASSLESALVTLCVQLRAATSSVATVRVDPAPGFVSLVSSTRLQSIGVRLEIGSAKNCNKNPVAEHAIGELRDELKRLNPETRCVSPSDLAIATSFLNSRLRGPGLSSQEMYFSRDQYHHTTIPLDDQKLIMQQHTTRLTNHPYDYSSKSRYRRPLPMPINLKVGDLVYLAVYRDKSKSRPRYLVVSIEGNFCQVRKFTNSQLRGKLYSVRLNECYHIPTIEQQPLLVRDTEDDQSSSEDESTASVPQEIISSTYDVEDTEPHQNYPSDPSPGGNAFESRPQRTRNMPKRFEDFVLS